MAERKKTGTSQLTITKFI